MSTEHDDGSATEDRDHLPGDPDDVAREVAELDRTRGQVLYESRGDYADWDDLVSTYQASFERDAAAVLAHAAAQRERDGLVVVEREMVEHVARLLRDEGYLSTSRELEAAITTTEIAP